MARPEWKPTEEQRKTVERMSGRGVPVASIAAAVGVANDTLYKHCRDDLMRGRMRIHDEIGGVIVEKALAGDSRCLELYAKCQMGWSEKQQHEISGPNGGPMQVERVEMRIIEPSGGDTDE